MHTPPNAVAIVEAPRPEGDPGRGLHRKVALPRGATTAEQEPLAASLAEGAAVGKLYQRPFVGAPKPGDQVDDGRVVRSWHRTNTSSSGQRKIFGRWYTDAAVNYTDGSKDYALFITQVPL